MRPQLKTTQKTLINPPFFHHFSLNPFIFKDFRTRIKMLLQKLQLKSWIEQNTEQYNTYSILLFYSIDIHCNINAKQIVHRSILSFIHSSIKNHHSLFNTSNYPCYIYVYMLILYHIVNQLHIWSNYILEHNLEQTPILL